MDFIIEIIFRVFIVRIVGLSSRYIFFRLIGKEKDIDELSGEKSKDGGLSQDFFNAIIGVMVIICLSVTIAYIVYS